MEVFRVCCTLTYGARVGEFSLDTPTRFEASRRGNNPVPSMIL